MLFGGHAERVATAQAASLADVAYGLQCVCRGYAGMARKRHISIGEKPWEILLI
jgi:hypothetical protein